MPLSLFAPLAALAWQHYRPRKTPRPALAVARGHRWLLDNFNAGGGQHGLLAWSMGAFFPALLAGLICAGLTGIWAFLGWLSEVVLLVFLFGFREASFSAASTARALAAGDLTHARSTLMAWNPGVAASEDEEGLVCQTLEETLKSALNTLFGVLFWYWLTGVTGALLYALSHACNEQWRHEIVFSNFARQVVYWMEWLPARILGFSFAIVGNFQDATECWRAQAHTWPDPNEGVILAAGAGALGIRLGGNLRIAQGEVLRPDLGMDEPASPEGIDAAVALIWRSALLWLAVAGLLGLGSL